MTECNLIVKATRLCNLRCTYCHDWRAGPGNTMSFRVLAHTVAAALQDPEHDRVTFIWHGGEPTVLPLSWFERVMTLQGHFARPGQEVRNVVQTNGTRVTQEWAEFLAENDWSVGVSIDGPPRVHDRRRVYVSGRGSFADVLKGLDTLRSAGARTSVLLVVDDEMIQQGPAAVYDMLVEHEVTRFGFNAVVPANAPDAPPGTPAAPYVTSGAMTDFLIGLYEHWLQVGPESVRIRELDALLDRIAGLPASTCQLQGNCLGGYFIVEPDGEVAHCDLFLGDPAYRLGNVLTESFSDMRAGSRMTELRQARAGELARLRHCPEFETCQGWCPHETYLSRRHDPAHRDQCCGLDRLLRYLRERAAPRRPRPVPLAVPTLRSPA
jgi:uncharacterized protein